MERTWKPTTTGILCIVGGVLGIILGIVLVVIGTVAGIVVPERALPFIGAIVTGTVAVGIVLGIVAIIGGIYALRRRKWGLALAGSICAVFPWWFLGIPAIIFVVLGKGEFK
jgi:lysylphosphatidylglycerol synthetase-like protein (DUF2156 family)